MVLFTQKIQSITAQIDSLNQQIKQLEYQQTQLKEIDKDTESAFKILEGVIHDFKEDSEILNTIKSKLEALFNPDISASLNVGTEQFTSSEIEMSLSADSEIEVGTEPSPEPVVEVEVTEPDDADDGRDDCAVVLNERCSCFNEWLIITFSEAEDNLVDPWFDHLQKSGFEVKLACQNNERHIFAKNGETNREDVFNWVNIDFSIPPRTSLLTNEETPKVESSQHSNSVCLHTNPSNEETPKVESSQHSNSVCLHTNPSNEETPKVEFSQHSNSVCLHTNPSIFYDTHSSSMRLFLYTKEDAYDTFEKVKEAGLTNTHEIHKCADNFILILSKISSRKQADQVVELWLEDEVEDMAKQEEQLAGDQPQPEPLKLEFSDTRSVTPKAYRHSAQQFCNEVELKGLGADFTSDDVTGILTIADPKDTEQIERLLESEPPKKEWFSEVAYRRGDLLVVGFKTKKLRNDWCKFFNVWLHSCNIEPDDFSKIEGCKCELSVINYATTNPEKEAEYWSKIEQIDFKISSKDWELKHRQLSLLNTPETEPKSESQPEPTPTQTNPRTDTEVSFLFQSQGSNVWVVSAKFNSETHKLDGVMKVGDRFRVPNLNSEFSSLEEAADAMWKRRQERAEYQEAS